MRSADGLSVGDPEGEAVGDGPLVVAGCIRTKKVDGAARVGNRKRGA